MDLNVIKIEITDKNINILRIPEEDEDKFCDGISQTYPLSKNVKIAIDGKSKNILLGDRDLELFNLKEELFNLKENNRLLENGFKQLCAELHDLVNERDIMIKALRYIKEQYEIDFKEELTKLEPRDESIYTIVVETLNKVAT